MKIYWSHEKVIDKRKKKEGRAKKVSSATIEKVFKWIQQQTREKSLERMKYKYK